MVDGAIVNKVSGDNLDPLSVGQHYIEVSTTNGLGFSSSSRSDL